VCGIGVQVQVAGYGSRCRCGGRCGGRCRGGRQEACAESRVVER